MMRGKEALMKKLAGYALCFAGFCLVSAVCYFFSYQRAMNQFIREASERDYDLMLELQNSAKEPDTSQEAAIGSENRQEEALEAGVANTERIKPNAKYTLESFDALTNQTIREEIPLPSEYAGLTREEIIRLLSDYMEDTPISEHEKGLFAFELLSFSNTELIMRKSYNQDLVPFKYYIAVRNGNVIVYYSDFKTIYEYTGIKAAGLPEQERLRLIEGIYIKTNAELYELLESYSS